MVPGCERSLEIQSYVFERKPDALVLQAGTPAVPERTRREVLAALSAQDPSMGQPAQDEMLRLLWLNDPRYVESAPPREAARLLRLLHRGLSNAGFFLGVEPPEEKDVEPNEVNVLFAVESPPPRNHLTQLFEVFHGLNVGVRRSLTMNLSTGAHPFFLGSFHVAHRSGGSLEQGGELFRRLRRLLYNTQILATESPAYRISCSPA